MYNTATQPVFTQPEPAPVPQPNSWTQRDYYTLGLLLLFTAFLNLSFLGSLEYFRHTEADRTLIAWEMADTGQFLIPHLLGSEILTKPPLFYWVLATLIRITGSASETVARIPSALAGIALVLFQFTFLRLSNISARSSLFSAVILATCIQTLASASVAEIDMLYCFSSTVALGTLFLSFRSPDSRWATISYLALTLAFFTKGPPILVFFAAPLLFHFFRQKNSRAQIISQHTPGIIFFLTISVVWVALLSREVGFQSLVSLFHEEIIERIVDESTRHRNEMFYPFVIIASYVPWSIFLLGAFVLGITDRKRLRSQYEALTPEWRDLLKFSLVVVGSAVISLSAAEGKSFRYMFPIAAFLANIFAASAFLLRRTRLETVLCDFGKILAIAAAPVPIILAFVLNFEGVPRISLIFSGLVMSASLFSLSTSCRTRKHALIFASLAACMISVRIGQWLIYTPHRNLLKSVQPTSAVIDDALPVGAHLYTVELYERWIAYYLKRGGRKVYRLTPQLVEKYTNHYGPVFILLNEEDESWRLDQLRRADPNLQILGTFNEPNHAVLLVTVDAQALQTLKPRREFPTTPTTPFL